ncbi:hypothetical protein CJ184_003780 [Actinotignum urinale]|nr:antitoxin VbhA family protein [Actinotignum urinale]WIK58403.1 hypothetical protein CJ184_003780 [Actinotignum urinale]
MKMFDIDQRWSQLFDGLTFTQKQNVMNVLASSWHEGWEPDYEDVKNLTDYAKGNISETEYDARCDELIGLVDQENCPAIRDHNPHYDPGINNPQPCENMRSKNS